MPDESVTWVITHRVRPDRRPEFEDWVKGIDREMTRFGGHQGMTVLRPEESHDSDYVIVVRFASYRDFRRWEQSTERAHWLELLSPLIMEAPTYRDETGLEAWFQLPGHRAIVPPPKWKMAILILAAIYPLILIVVPVLGAIAGDQAFIGISIQFNGEFVVRTLVTAVVLVFLMTWIAMPQLTKLARPWLYPTR